MSKSNNQNNSSKGFFSKYKSNFLKLLCANLLFCIPLAVLGTISFALIYFTKQINIYILALAIPLISPFAAALTYICKRITVGQDIKLLRDFKNGIKNNWKYFLAGSLIEYIITIGFWITFSFYNDFIGNPIVTVSFIMSLIVALFFLLMSFSFFVMAVSVDLKFVQIIKNSVFLIAAGFANHIKTLVSLLIITFFIYTLLQFSVSLIIPLCVLGVLTITVLPTLIVYIIVFNSYNSIEKHVINSHKNYKNDVTAKFGDSPEPEKLDYDELVRLSKGNPNEYVSVGGKMLRRSTVAKMAEAHKNDL